MRNLALTSTKNPAAVRSRRQRPKYLAHLILIVLCLFIGFPMIFSIIKSTQNVGQIAAYPPFMGIGNQTLQNYWAAWNTSNLVHLMGNTILVAVAVTFGKTVTSLLAGTAFVYFRFPLRS